MANYSSFNRKNSVDEVTAFMKAFNKSASGSERTPSIGRRGARNLMGGNKVGDVGHIADRYPFETKSGKVRINKRFR